MKKLISLIGLFIILTSMNSQTGIPRAQAMFIYNFSRLVEWPTSYKSGQFIIGVIGASATYNELKTYTANKAVGSQKIVVKKFESAAEIGQCHILFVPFNKTKQMSEITSTLGSKSTLLICEKNGAVDSGAAINFIVIGDKLKFEVSMGNATSKNIKMSSKLSEMAYKSY
jgi:hypothetical protein